LGFEKTESDFGRYRGILVMTNTVKSFHDLVAWQKAMELVTEIYKVSQKFPKEEMFGLKSQIRRAAVSIPSNIAEGRGKSSTGEFQQFL